MDRRATIGRALLKRDLVSENPAFLSLTEDERLKGLGLFAAEGGATREQHQTFESVPGLVTSLPPKRTRRDAMPRVRRAQRALLWDMPLLVATLTVVCLVFAPTPLRVVPTTPGQPRMPRSEQVSQRTEPPRGVSTAMTVANVTNGPTVAAEGPADEAPAAARESIRLARDVRRSPPDPPIPTVPVSTPAPAATASIPEPAVLPIPLDAPAVTASLALEPRPVAPVPASAPRAESAVPVRVAAPETAIHAVLSEYRAAYEGLDVSAARAVWPSVDPKALRKAFDRLEEQRLVFDSCDVAVSGGVRAVASCRGSVSYVPRVGKARRDDQRQWEFALSKVDDAWLIDTVSAR